MDITRLDLRSYVDFVEAVLTEPMIHGGTDIDTILNGVEKQVLEQNAERLVEQGRGEEVFETPEWQQRAAAMEELMPPSFVPGDEDEEPRPDVDLSSEFDLDEIDVPDADAFRPSSFMPHAQDTERDET